MWIFVHGVHKVHFISWNYMFYFLIQYTSIWWRSNPWTYMPFFHNSYSTHWGRDKTGTIAQTTFEMWIPIKISLKFVHKGLINNIPALVQITARRRPGNKPLSETMIVSLLMHICVTRPQWVKWNRNQHQVIETSRRIFPSRNLANYFKQCLWLFGTKPLLDLTLNCNEFDPRHTF